MSEQNPTPHAPAPAGWYPDPQAPGQQRYWDGAAWTAGTAGNALTAPGVAGPTTSTKAIIGLVLAIVSWPLCPIIAAIPALILAHASDREITASDGRITGAGLNTATRIIAWLNIAVSLVAGVVIAVLAAIGVIFTAEVASTLDPSINSKTGLADGQYALEPSRRVNFDNECSYGGVVSMPGNPNVGDVTVYGRGPVECPDLVEVQVVFIDVTDGVARIISVE
ncbi:MAG: hypothetical protein RL134_458 [Actinomycetota bacterium]|jgi:hypothetical protein